MVWPLVYYSYNHVIYSSHVCAHCLYLLPHFLGLISAVNISWSHLSNSTVTYPLLPLYTIVLLVLHITGIIRSLKLSKAKDVFGMDSTMLKDIGSSLASPITKIVNL